MNSYYESALICENGHIITTSLERNPKKNQNHCSLCGASTLSKCHKCNEMIHGYYYIPGVVGCGSMEKAPSYCHSCGAPYPWTLLALEAAQELLEIEDILSKEELDYLSKNMSAIVSDTPKTPVVATKLKLAIGKLSSNVGSAIYDIFVDVASETAKKTLFPQLP